MCLRKQVLFPACNIRSHSWGQVLCWGLNCFLGCLCPLSECLGQSPAYSGSDPGPGLRGWAAGDLVSSHPCGRSAWSSCPLSGPAVAAVGIWEVNQQMEVFLFLPPSLSVILSDKLVFKKESVVVLFSQWVDIELQAYSPHSV